VLLAATNRPEVLDPALLRASRFDRQVLVDRPDKVGRAAILKIHLKQIQTATEIDPAQIAAMTPGFSGADLANLVRIPVDREHGFRLIVNINSSRS
jgi:cell division protease FtsH